MNINRVEVLALIHYHTQRHKAEDAAVYGFAAHLPPEAWRARVKLAAYHKERISYWTGQLPSAPAQPAL